jgi:hypothetical protein
VILPREWRGRPFPAAAVRGLLGPPRQERCTPRESRASAPAGRSAPERLGWTQTVQPSPKRPRRGVSPKVTWSAQIARTGEPGAGGSGYPPPFLMRTPFLSFPLLNRASGFAGDADDAASSPGRIIESRRAVNLARRQPSSAPPPRAGPGTRYSLASPERRDRDAAAPCFSEAKAELLTRPCD